jgi:hypothetical protein
MRKITGSVLVILLLSLAAVYVFIPSEMSIKGSQMVYQPSSSVTRAMTQISKWPEWMPKEIVLKANSTLVATIDAELSQDGIQVPVVFSIENGEGNNSFIRYETSMNNIGWSPIERIQYALFARKIKHQLDLVLAAATAHYNYNKGVYGFDIVETKVKDSSYVAIDQTLTDTPSLVQIYQMVDQLAAFINTQKGKAIGDPMVNITRVEAKEVYIQVAIPLERDIPVNGAFSIKKMVLGNLLSVKVQGDQAKVNEAFEATKQYITDKQKYSPAIPFIIYNTNRLLEKDSSRWISTISYPIY